MKRTDLPDWPRGLSRDASAAYVGVGTTLFDELVADGRLPKPGKINSRILWDRRQLDAALDDLFQSSNENAWDAALR